MSIKQLAHKHNYLSPDVNCIFDYKIWEYDIRQANINALKSMGRIDDTTYNLLQTSPKQLREVRIGKMIQRDRSLQTSIYDGIEKAKFEFLTQNHINESQVLRIANDSIYVIAPLPQQITKIDINGHALEFVLKNVFGSYIKINKNIQIFISTDSDNWTIDIKGINDSKLPLHESFLGFLCQLIDYYNNAGRELAIQMLSEFFQNYVNRRLPIVYYRELNSESGFRINGPYETFILSDPNCIPIDIVDISWNLYILRNIYSYLMTK